MRTELSPLNDVETAAEPSHELRGGGVDLSESCEPGHPKFFLLLLLLEKYLLRQRAVNIPRYSSIFGTESSSSSLTERMYRAGFNHHSSPGEDFLATQRPGVNRGRERVDCFCYLFSRCWCRRRGKECQNKTGMPLTDGVDWWRRVF